MIDGSPVLHVENLSITFTQYARLARKTLPVLTDLHVTVHAGEMVAVIGASGSGKSLLAHAILDILPTNARASGNILYDGQPLTSGRAKALRGREIVLIPQSVSYLDPLMKVGPQIRNGDNTPSTRAQADGLLARYGLPAETAGLYPFELSGGMTRRILISTAMMQSPRLVIADEPTPGLHEEAARRVLSHLREMADAGAAVLLITHDLRLALATCDRVSVFYAGTTVEEAAAVDFEDVETLRHPYTRALWRAMPQHGFAPTAGTQPYAGELPGGCPYRPRCPLATDACGGEIPYISQRGGYVRCIHADQREAVVPPC